jgi:hypothetical protein
VPKSKPKVTVVQLATPNVDEYASYSIMSVNHYCKLHEYQHVIQRIKTVEYMHINWTKIDLLKKAFDFYPENDFVLLVDADVVISDYHKNVTYFINKYCTNDHHIIMAQDTPLRLTLSPRPNAGFILLRNSAIARQMVDDWIEASTGAGAHLNDTHPRNQLVYWNYVMPEYLNHQVVLPRGYFQKPMYLFTKNIMPSNFLFHITQSDIADRVNKMKQLCHKYISNVSEKLSYINDMLSTDDTLVVLN